MIASRHIEIFVMIFASILAIYVGSQIVTLPIPILIILFSAVLLFGWALTAGNSWWVPVLPSALILGIFKLGVKVTPPMVGVGLAVIGLIPLILVQSQKILQSKRRPLPFIFYAAALYFLVRMMVDIIPAQGPRLNLYRLVFEAIWPFAFGFLFHHYGNLSVARAALWTIFIVLSIRCAAAIVGYVAGVPIYIPGIDYLLSARSNESLVAMRGVGFSLLTVVLVMWNCYRSILQRLALAPVMIGACALVMMGQGRFATFMMMMLPAIFFAWARQWFLLLIAFGAGFGIFVSVNLAPQLLDQLNPAVARAVSGVILTTKTADVQIAAQASDDWHNALKVEGYRRWTLTPMTFLFGYGIRATPDFYSETTGKMNSQLYVERAADLGAYECSLWLVLGVFGATGMTLYTLLFLYFWRQVFPYFLRRPIGTFWEGMLFWGVYASVSWFVVSYFEGGFPAVELVLMIIAADAVQEGKLEREHVQNSPARARPSRLAPLSSPPLRA
jgi:hypothetical protein